ncbi:TolC family protein [Pedosphaera parvula]|uniref:Outer membrane efflux protein n=1 Tax=Pedosphaera parvula (strain Ellin514) TaxID=320771 RepID=B9XPS1_PEDPL|nr:TolC family protein [Pedosphaera parvula]EEF58194.1 outer membrane efflux protein [Pedosphaera parvula Ellin514]
MNRWFVIIAVVVVGLAGCVRFQPHPISPSETAAKLESRSLNDTGFKAFLEKNLQKKFADWPAANWDFETLTLAALYYHPSLDVARAQWDLARGGEVTAAERPNPTLSAVPGYDFSATSPANPWIPAVSFDLPIETMGKRRYRKTQAAQLSESARLNIATAAWQVRINLRSALIDYTTSRQREGWLQRQLEIQERVIKLLQQRLEAGALASSELTLVRIAAQKIRLDLLTTQTSRADARARVAEAIGIPVSQLEGMDFSYDPGARLPAASELVTEAIRRQALQGRADVLAILAEYESSQSALQLQIAKQYPDVHLGPGYQFDQADNKFSFAITAELPILNQNQGPIAEAEAKRLEVAARFMALQSKVIAEIDRSLAVYRTTSAQIGGLDALAAEQKRQSQSVEAQVNVGVADQLDLANARLDLATSELVQLDTRIKLYQALGAVEDALQRPIDSIKPGLIEQSPRRQAMKENKP